MDCFAACVLLIMAGAWCLITVACLIEEGLVVPERLIQFTAGILGVICGLACGGMILLALNNVAVPAALAAIAGVSLGLVGGLLIGPPKQGGGM